MEDPRQKGFQNFSNIETGLSDLHTYSQICTMIMNQNAYVSLPFPKAFLF